MAMNNVDLRKVTAENHKVLERTPNGGDIMFASLEKIVLFGLDHGPAMGTVTAAGSLANYGSITVKKPGGGTQKGTLTVLGFRKDPAERKLFMAGVRLFTNMEVVFV